MYEIKRTNATDDHAANLKALFNATGSSSSARVIPICTELSATECVSFASGSTFSAAFSSGTFSIEELGPPSLVLPVAFVSGWWAWVLMARVISKSKFSGNCTEINLKREKKKGDNSRQR